MRWEQRLEIGVAIELVLQQTEVISEQWAREDLGSKMDPPDGTPVMGTSGAPQKNPAKPGWMKWLDQAVNRASLKQSDRSNQAGLVLTG